MTHVVRDPSAGDRDGTRAASAAAGALAMAEATAAYDSASFAAGRDCGTRVAACIARACALEMIDRSHWWNRRGHRLMADALVAYAEELEAAADGDADGAAFHPVRV